MWQNGLLLMSSRSKKFAFAIIFFAFYLMLASWAMTEVPGGPPDEPQNFVYSAAVARGEVFLPILSLNPYPVWSASVPKWILSFNNASVYTLGSPPHGLSINPLSLVAQTKNPTLLTTGETNLAHLPPFVFFIFGVPTLFLYGIGAIFTIRLLASLLACLFVFSSFFLISNHNKSEFAFLGLLLALTPEAIFLGASINPSGLEIFGAIALWSFVAFVITEKQRTELIKGLCLIAGLLCLVRTLSPLWVVFGALFILIGIGWQNFLNYLKTRSLLKYYLWVLLSSVATFIWDLLKGRFPAPIKFYLTNDYFQKPFLIRFLISLQRAFLFFKQAYNNILGAKYIFNAQSVIWIILNTALVLFGLIYLKRKYKAIILIGIVLNFVIPAFFEALLGSSLGQWWNGRYSLPLYVQTPILSSIFIAQEFLASQQVSKIKITAKYFFGLVILFWFSTEISSLYEMIKFYMVGTLGSPNIFFNSQAKWQTYPFGFQTIWLALNLVSITIICIYIILSFLKKSKLSIININTFIRQIVKQ